MAASERPKTPSGLTNVDLDQIAEKLLQRLRSVSSEACAAPSMREPRPKAPFGPDFPLRLTGEPVGDGQGGISAEAELADVLMEMFRDSYSDAGKETFTQAVQRCVVDELVVLELAMSNEDSIHEAPRMLERIRHRILVAQWLDERIAGSGPAQEGGES